MSRVLTLNAGSSSLKFAVFEGSPLERVAAGQVERIGPAARLVLDGVRDLGAVDHAGATRLALDVAGQGGRPDAIGHRIVHGGPDRDRPMVLDDAVTAEIEALAPLAPLHQPQGLAAVRAAREAFPDRLQVACFDTAFHRGHPWVADAYALPRRFHDAGVRRYGFHGLSYESVAGRLREDHPALHTGRVVVAHLGNGASLCALRGGRSVASTMGFTPLDGLPMGTRCGQLDPGVVIHLMRAEGMNADAIEALLYRESGLSGLSGGVSDMRALLASDAAEAADAVAYFVHRLRREIGAMAADLGGLDGLVFTGGIGRTPPRSGRGRSMGWASWGWRSTRRPMGPGRRRSAAAPCRSCGSRPTRSA